MKLLLLLLCIGLLPLYGLSQIDQQASLGLHGYRLVRTVNNADFDYQKLDFYFTNKAALDGLDKSGGFIFEPIDGDYTLHFFVGDLLAEAVMTPDEGLELAYVPAALAGQKLLVLKVMDSRVFTDGFLLPYGVGELPLSESLFRVRTKELPVKRRLNLDELNLRNLYNRNLRADAGMVYLSENLFWPYAESIRFMEERYNLVKKVSDADFNYELFNDCERYNAELEKEGQDILGIFEPVAGDFTYYKFIADVVINDLLWPEHEEDRDSFADKMEVFFSQEEYVSPLIVVRNVLILKTDVKGMIVDGFGAPVDFFQMPASASLKRLGRQGLRLYDGMSLHELALTNDEIYGFETFKGKISLFPK